MKYFIFFVIMVTYQVQSQAMETVNHCDIAIELERNKKSDIEIETNPDNKYLYTGYGLLTCNGENPMHIFSAIRWNDTNATIKTPSKLMLEIKDVELEYLSYIFQSYLVHQIDDESFLTFKGNDYFPDLKLPVNISSDELPSSDQHQILLNKLNKSLVIIEQDQFFPDYD